MTTLYHLPGHPVSDAMHRLVLLSYARVDVVSTPPAGLRKGLARVTGTHALPAVRRGSVHWHLPWDVASALLDDEAQRLRWLGELADRELCRRWCREAWQGLMEPALVHLLEWQRSQGLPWPDRGWSAGAHGRNGGGAGRSLPVALDRVAEAVTPHLVNGRLSVADLALAAVLDLWLDTSRERAGWDGFAQAQAQLPAMPGALRAWREGIAAAEAGYSASMKG